MATTTRMMTTDRADVHLNVGGFRMAWFPMTIRACRWVAEHPELVCSAPIGLEMNAEPHGERLLRAMCLDGLDVRCGDARVSYAAETPG